MSKKTHLLPAVRVSEDERAALEAEAAGHPRGIAGYIRERVFGAPPPPPKGSRRKDVAPLPKERLKTLETFRIDDLPDDNLRSDNGALFQ